MGLTSCKTMVPGCEHDSFLSTFVKNKLVQNEYQIPKLAWYLHKGLCPLHWAPRVCGGKSETINKRIMKRETETKQPLSILPQIMYTI